MRPLPGQSFDELLKSFNYETIENHSKFTPGFIAPALPASGSIQDLELLADELGINLSRAGKFLDRGSLFSEAGYRSIVYGPGDIANAHQPNESVELE